MDASSSTPTRTQAQSAVADLGWRYLLGTLCLSVPVGSLTRACELATAVTTAAGDDADPHLRLDLRPDRLELSLQTRDTATLGWPDVELARRISAALPDGAGTGAGPARGSQMLELAIDTLDAAAIRPFWKAVLAFTDEAGDDGPDAALVDPAGQLPAIWFQQLDAPRPQRNRIHLDVTVAHDAAPDRVAATLAAGGRLLDDSRAPSFWVLADADGNEACVCTWLGRDERDVVRAQAAAEQAAAEERTGEERS
jgi:4a-hydroxytetrahydrobiopterin dehydratase